MSQPDDFNRAVVVNAENIRRAERKIAAEIEKRNAFAIENAKITRDCGLDINDLIAAETRYDVQTFLDETVDAENLHSCSYIFEALEVALRNTQIKEFIQKDGDSSPLPDVVTLSFEPKHNLNPRKIFLILALYSLDYKNISLDNNTLTFTADVRNKKNLLPYLSALLRLL